MSREGEWSAHLRGISEGFNSAAIAMRQLCSLASDEAASVGPNPDCQQASNAFHELARSFGSSAAALADGLSGLDAMCGAMEVMKGDSAMGSATWGILLNIMHVLSTQLAAQQNDLGVAVSNAKTKIGLLKTTASRSLSRSVEAPKPVKSADVSREQAPAIPAAVPPPSPPHRMESNADDAVEHVVKKKKKKTHRMLDEEVSQTPADNHNLSLMPVAVVAEAPDDVKKKKKKKKGKEDEGAGAKDEIQLADDVQQPVPSVQSRQAVSVTPPVSLFARKPWEPDFFSVQTSISDSLGPLVHSSKPADVFSPPENIIAAGNVLHDYFVELDPAGRIGAVLVRCWLNVEMDIAKDFAADVLDIDDVSVEAFSYVGKHVVVEDEEHLTGVPGCGWRRMVPTSEDADPRRLYTMYLCIDHPAQGLHHSLIIHDVVVEGAKREEVVTVLTPTPHNEESAPFARVVVYAASSSAAGKRRASAALGTSNLKYAAAIGSITKELLDNAGFVEVSQEEVSAELDVRSDSAPSASAHAAKTTVAETENFVDPNTLKGPKEKKGAIDIALGIGKTLALAPVTATKKVTSIVSNVAETAMLSQTDAKFAEWFPKLSSETIVDTFNCALSEGAALKQGVLYITKHWLAFNATVLSKRFTVSFDDVREIRKAKFMKLFENALEIETYDGDVYFFASFIARDLAYAAVYGAWRTSGD